MNQQHYPRVFAGVAIIIFGLLIIVYDYPQVMFLESLTEQEFLSLAEETKEKYPRLQMELFIGISLIIFGAVLIGFSFLKVKILPRFKK